MYAEHQRTQILCENCGYPLDQLESASNCPECGRPTSESLPEHRIGSPWQQRRTLTGFVQTHLALLRQPRVLFRNLRVAPDGGKSLLAVNLLLASAVLVDPWVGVFIRDPARGMHGDALWLALMARLLSLGAATLAGAFVLALALLAFTSVVRGWSQIQHRRTNVHADLQLMAHASGGLVYVAALGLLGLALHYQVFALSQKLGMTFMMTSIPGFKPGAMTVATFTGGLVVLGGYAIGLWMLMTRLRIGLRALRFANQPRNLERVDSSGPDSTAQLTFDSKVEPAEGVH